MILLKRFSRRNRWPLPSLSECIEMVDYIADRTPSKEQFSQKYKIGEPKARSYLENLRATGLIYLDKGKYYPSDIQKETKHFSSVDLSTAMYYFFTQNMSLCNWLVYDLFSSLTKTGKIFINLEEIKYEYYSKFVVSEDKNIQKKKNIYKPLFCELYSLFGDLSGSIYHESAFSSLELFISDNHSNLLSIKPVRPSSNIMLYLFNKSCNHYYRNINNFSITSLVENKTFPFRAFFLTTDEVKKYLLEFQKSGFLRIIEAADLNHIYIN